MLCRKLIGSLVQQSNGNDFSYYFYSAFWVESTVKYVRWNCCSIWWQNKRICRTVYLEIPQNGAWVCAKKPWRKEGTPGVSRQGQGVDMKLLVLPSDSHYWTRFPAAFAKMTCWLRMASEMECTRACSVFSSFSVAKLRLGIGNPGKD